MQKPAFACLPTKAGRQAGRMTSEALSVKQKLIRVSSESQNLNS